MTTKGFQCSSASRKFLNYYTLALAVCAPRFQCSSASRKFLNFSARVASPLSRQRFSALQRAENSSIQLLAAGHNGLTGFSALQRAENSSIRPNSVTSVSSSACGFSALQRAENSSMFGCVASRRTGTTGFSALQRAENSSIRPMWSASAPKSNQVSVLFSEPKIPQSGLDKLRVARYTLFQCSSASRKFLNYKRPQPRMPRQRVSVLFSEPKIPQFVPYARAPPTRPRFQCSSASRKFLNARTARAYTTSDPVSVLFSEPKIPQ